MCLEKYFCSKKGGPSSQKDLQPRHQLTIGTEFFLFHLSSILKAPKGNWGLKVIRKIGENKRKASLWICSLIHVYPHVPALLLTVLSQSRTEKNVKEGSRAG